MLADSPIHHGLLLFYASSLPFLCNSLHTKVSDWVVESDMQDPIPLFLKKRELSSCTLTLSVILRLSVSFQSCSWQQASSL